MNFSYEILTTIGGSSVIMALFAWLGKRYLDKFAETERARNAVELEKQKAELTHEVERIKVELKKESALFSSAIQAGVGPHSLLLTPIRSLIDLCRQFLDTYFSEASPVYYREQFESAERAFNNAIKIINDHELLLGKDVCVLAREILRKVRYEIESSKMAIGFRLLDSAPSDPLAKLFLQHKSIDNFDLLMAYKEAKIDVAELEKHWFKLLDLLYSRANSEKELA